MSLEDLQGIRRKKKGQISGVGDTYYQVQFEIDEEDCYSLFRLDKVPFAWQKALYSDFGAK